MWDDRLGCVLHIYSLKFELSGQRNFICGTEGKVLAIFILCPKMDLGLRAINLRYFVPERFYLSPSWAQDADVHPHWDSVMSGQNSMW